MLERLTRMEDFDGLPKVTLSTCEKFYQHLRNEESSDLLMTWSGELYLELHNGTYTNMAENKLYNR